MLTDDEKEILSSEEKRKSVSPITVRNRLQRIRDKAAKAIDDLLFITNKRPDQIAQVLGLTKKFSIPPNAQQGQCHILSAPDCTSKWCIVSLVPLPIF